MRWMLPVLLIAGCGSDSSGGTPGFCVHMSRMVTQEHGACRVDGAWIVGASCGNEADCPTGWTLACEPSPEDPGIGINCTYGGMCANGECDYVQTLNGERGLIVMPDPAKPGECTFRPCQ